MPISDREPFECDIRLSSSGKFTQRRLIIGIRDSMHATFAGEHKTDKSIDPGTQELLKPLTATCRFEISRICACQELPGYDPIGSSGWINASNHVIPPVESWD